MKHPIFLRVTSPSYSASLNNRVKWARL